MLPLFADRREAGRALAFALEDLRDRSDLVVLGVPRGGVVVAYEVARSLGAPLDVLVVRKLGLPHHPEVAFGAVGPGGVRVLDPRLAAALPEKRLAEIGERERLEVLRRERIFRGDATARSVAGRTVVLVDDGIATGASMRAAIRVARKLDPREIVVATPLAAPEAARAVGEEADTVATLATPGWFYSVGAWYEDFAQVDDTEVTTLLGRARAIEANRRRGAPGDAFDERVTVVAHDVELELDVSAPERPRGLVIATPVDREVTRALASERLATVQLDLLAVVGEDGARRRDVRFDIPRLTARLVDVIDWAAAQPRLAGLPVGLLATGTGAAAAIAAAAARPLDVAAIVGRGGRPERAAEMLRRDRAPTLLVVGELDAAVLALNRRAARMMPAATIAVVAGAHHQFEEPGTRDEALRLAQAWFAEHLPEHGGRAASTAS